MSNLVEYAKRELKAAELLDSDDEMDALMATCVLQLVEAFSKQEHSGFSAGYCLHLFKQLASFKPLVPLSGNDDEWMEVGEGMWQNKRAATVFKAADGKAYDLDAVVYREPSGATFTKGGERHYIEFPYTPTTKYINLDEQGYPL